MRASIRNASGGTVEAVREFLVDRTVPRIVIQSPADGATGVEDVGRVAVNAFTGPPVLPPLSTILRRALGLDFHRAIELSNDRRFLTAIVPAGNVITTANELSRFFQLLLNEGELDGIRIFEPRTIHRAVAEQSYLEVDFTIALPLRYGMGFMLGAEWLSLFGPDTEHAFGHVGFTNVIAWADPERQLSVALMTTGKPVLYPQIYSLWDVMRQIGLATMLYADANKDFLPYGYAYTWPGQRDLYWWQDLCRPYINSESVYSCPSARPHGVFQGVCGVWRHRPAATSEMRRVRRPRATRRLEMALSLHASPQNQQTTKKHSRRRFHGRTGQNRI